MKKIDNQIKNSVSQLRAERGVRQIDLANAIGVTRQTIISMEKGNYTPSVLLAIKIARFFSKNVEDIFKLNNTYEQYKK